MFVFFGETTGNIILYHLKVAYSRDHYSNTSNPTLKSRQHPIPPHCPSHTLTNLTKDGLALTPSSVVSLEALAHTITVVADATAGAVASLNISVSAKDISARGALLKGAVRSTEAEVAMAAHGLVVVPGADDRGAVSLSDGGGDGGAVGGASRGGKGRLRRADAAAGAVIRANSTLTSDTLVTVEANALAGFGVAGALIGALSRGVGLIGSCGNRNPRLASGAGAG